MRFGLVHRLMTDALAVLGVLAVVSTASLGFWMTLTILIGLAVAVVIPESLQTKAFLGQFSTLTTVTLFVVQCIRLAIGGAALDIAVEMAVVLQVVRLATRRGAAHDQQIIVLAFLHLVAGTVLGGGLTYAFCFIGFLIVAPGALVLSHLRREVEGNYRQGARDRTGLPVDVPRILRSRRVVGRPFLAMTCLLSVPILLFTSALFLIFPRASLSLLLLSHPPSGRLIGFSDRVDLGDVGVLRSNPSIALRFEPSELPDPPPPRMILRLRGTAFDSYDGRAWSRTQNERRPVERISRNPDTIAMVRPPDPERDHMIAFDLEPINPPILFFPPHVVAVRTHSSGHVVFGDPGAVQRGSEGEWRYNSTDAHGFRYDVFVADNNDPVADTINHHDRNRYLDVPRSLPPRVGALAQEWTAGIANQAAIAHAIEDHLHTKFTYDLASPSAGTTQPIDHFLFESKRGHCEFFSTSMAIMLRKLGIPARNVTGFLGGTYNRFGHYYAVREGDAHSWVEAYIDDAAAPGWRTFDPTPSAGTQLITRTTGTLMYLRDFFEALSERWNRYVIGYDTRTQRRLVTDVSARYERLRSVSGLNRGFLAHLTQPWVLVAAMGAAIAWTLVTVWKRFRQRERPVATIDTPYPIAHPDLEGAAMLYRSLERALASHGITRKSYLPPLKHAEELHQRQHPLADEVLDLTHVYLAARFGGMSLTHTVKRDFERRVKAITHLPPTRLNLFGS